MRLDAKPEPMYLLTGHSQDDFGQRYTVDLWIRGTERRQAVVRTGWFVPYGTDEVRLVTLYVRR